VLVFRKAAEAGGDGVRGFVGLQIAAADGGGVVVQETLDGSPAKAAGLKKGDQVLRVGTREVSDIHATVDAVRAAKPGETLTFHIRRDGAEKDVAVKVGMVPFTVLAQLD
jgi:S1-C subfamily serine protease